MAGSFAFTHRLKHLEDEWQFVESPNDGTEEPADPHMSTPKPSPSPTPQSTAENATEAKDTPSDTVDDAAPTETLDTDKDTEQEQAQSEKGILVESPKSEEIPQVTAGNTT